MKPNVDYQNPAARLLMLAAAALLLGFLGDVLLRATPWGINLVLWLLALAGAIPLLGMVCRIGRREGSAWLSGLLVFVVLALAWRDAGALKVLDFAAVFAALAATSLRLPASRWRRLLLTDAALGAIAWGLHSLIGTGVLVGDDLRRIGIDPGSGEEEHRLKRFVRPTTAVVRGAVLGVPLVLLFGGLFASADAAFAGLAGRLVHPDLGVVLGHLFLISLIAWLTAGFLRGVLVGKSVAIATGGARQSLSLDAQWSTRIAPGEPPLLEVVAMSTVRQLRHLFSLEAVEIGVILGLLDLLFLSFVAVQIRYFFGGAALVEASSTLTYAEYARRGFFELVIVAALVVPLLLTLEWLLRAHTARTILIFRLLASILLALVAVVVVSALQRMRMYQAEYGMTELRLYATAFMGWIIIVLIWLAATVLSNRRDRFVFGAALAGLCVLAALNVLNPSALIVRLNADRTLQGRPFDTTYATSLGADAIPQLFAILPELQQHDRCQVVHYLTQEWSSPQGDWRSWDIGREKALRTVREHQSELNRQPCR